MGVVERNKDKDVFFFQKKIENRKKKIDSILVLNVHTVIIIVDWCYCVNCNGKFKCQLINEKELFTCFLFCFYISNFFLFFLSLSYLFLYSYRVTPLPPPSELASS